MRLRKREAGSDDPAETVEANQPFLRRVAQADMFPKPKEDYKRTQTTSGGVVSTVAVVVILLLVFYEGAGYVMGRDAYATQLSVDRSSRKDMLVNIDIDFPKTPCESLSLDILDAAATRRFNVTRNLYKTPLGYKGESIFQGKLPSFVAEADEEELSQADSGPIVSDTECVPCFLPADKRKVSAQVRESCCTSCAEVMKAYRVAKLLPPPHEEVRLCLGELSRVNPGCNIRGTVVMKKVNSALLLGPRRTKSGYSIQDVLRFNVAHKINKFTIGDERVNRFSRHTEKSPLQGRSFAPESSAEMRYRLEVVPTTYSVNGKPQRYSTYEYSAHWSGRHVQLGMAGQIPQVVFSFDLTPIQVDYTFARPPFLHFLVQLCGIVGGLFVVLGIVDNAVSWAAAKLKGAA